MIEEFDVAVWRANYDRVQAIGAQLKDAYHDWDGNPPLKPISLSERNALEKEIDSIKFESDEYLDRCKMHPNNAKWKYDRNNEITWASSEKFAFAHLLSCEKYVTIDI